MIEKRTDISAAGQNETVKIRRIREKIVCQQHGKLLNCSAKGFSLRAQQRKGGTIIPGLLPKACNQIDAKSIMGIFSLDLSKPIDLSIHADDELDSILNVLKPYIVEE